MGIHDEDIARVRSSADLVALIGEHTEVKRSGRSWMARCPLHGERTPSMSISPEKGVYYCFGCQRSGDAITFLQEIDGVDFAGAVESLAGRYGIPLRYTSSGEGKQRARKRSLVEAVGKAVEFYHQRLLTGSDSGEARSYLRSRGYDGELVRRYQIGWAPDDWDQLARYLKLSPEDLADSGLGFVNKAGRQQDSFRARVMFPIFDERGDAVGFGGRILPGQEGPKYKNTTTQAEVYDKSRVLYGLYAHRDGIVKAGEAIICEGYTDVIGYANAGIPRAVATCGTAMTEDHVRLLKRFSANRLVLSFDADAAGLAAADRVYAWEREYELDIRVADLPAGVDPDDLAREDPEGLRRAVEHAQPYLKYRIGRVLDAADLSTVEGRVRAAEAAVDLVREHPSESVRDQYLIEIADRARVDVGGLRKSVNAPRRTPAARSGAPTGAGRHTDASRSADGGTWRDRGSDDHSVDHYDDYDGPSSEAQDGGFGEGFRLTPEDEALRLMIHVPEQVEGRLAECLFGDLDRRSVYTALAMAEVTEAADLLSPRAASLLHRLAVDPGDTEVDDVLAGVARLSADRTVRDLQLDLREATTSDKRQELTTAIAWLKRQTEMLGDRSTREAALSQLIPWLIQREEVR